MFNCVNELYDIYSGIILAALLFRYLHWPFKNEGVIQPHLLQTGNEGVLEEVS